MQRIEAATHEAWRKWLAEHHLKEKSVEVLIYKKHTGKPSLSHQELMHDAICFGWIDTTIKRLDEDTFIRRFARRTDKSKWSDNTLRYAKHLLAEGKMSPEGIKRYKEGMSRPTHDAGIPKNPVLEGDVKKALEEKKLLARFEAFPPSARRTFLRWIAQAKQLETRKKRIARLIESLRSNIKSPF